MKPGRLRRCLRRAVILIVLAVLIFVVAPMIYIEGFCGAADSETPQAQNRPQLLSDIQEPNYQRSEARTYLTFPEWYIVYSFEDFGNFLERGSESGFPYLTHILGFWTSYCAVNRLTADSEGAAGEAKVMIYTIGVSYSVEYGLKGLYENTIGRVSEWLRGPKRTAEDLFARATAQDYAAFLYAIPWYKYPFDEKLSGVWNLRPEGNPSPVRRWERKFALSAEYGIKVIYAWLIQKALAATMAPAKLSIMSVVTTLPEDVLRAEPRIKILRALDAEYQLIETPRYQQFTEIAIAIAHSGQRFVEIAGNDEILLTAILSDDSKPEIAGARELFSLPLGGRPGYRRAAYQVEVAQLADVIRSLEDAAAKVEHLYDY